MYNIRPKMTMGDREVYRDCMRNHAATLGTYATDGCGEFSPSPASDPLRCAACGCHRNFHRKVADALLDSSDHQKRRSRTKFSPEQKESMLRFSEKIGWRIPRRDGDVDEVARFCKEIGVGRQVFKVWMHNHKSDNANSSATSSSNAANGDANHLDNGVRVISQ